MQQRLTTSLFNTATYSDAKNAQSVISYFKNPSNTTIPFNYPWPLGSRFNGVPLYFDWKPSKKAAIIFYFISTLSDAIVGDSVTLGHAFFKTFCHAHGK